MMFVCFYLFIFFYSAFFSLDFDMKKDIDTLIEEERAEILLKYEKVRMS